ncbi:hypothetical protein [Spirillospora sp. NPDC047279]
MTSRYAVRPEEIAPQSLSDLLATGTPERRNGTRRKHRRAMTRRRVT